MSEIADRSDSSVGETPQPKQLRMTVPTSLVRKLPDVAMPSGCELRAYRPGDERSWLKLLELGGFPEWDFQRLQAFLGGAERREGSRVVTKGTTIVAATFASRETQDGKIGSLDFVVTHPRYRRRRLARAVCTAVLRFLEGRNYQTVTLATDDWRLDAIALYLSLGFVPVMEGEDMPSRWAEVMKQLKSGRKWNA